MANFCLLPKQVDDFKAKIVDGTINPDELSNMSSDERHTVLSGIFGEDSATKVNSLFESKMLLKNKQSGYITWAKNVAGITEPVRRDLISKIEKMDERILNPEDEKMFLRDLAETKLGVGVSQEEAKTIAEMSDKVVEAKNSIEKGGDRLTYGRAKVALGNYVSDLKNNANKFTLGEFKENIGGSIAKGASEVAGNAKAIKASMDNSAIFRQGWKTLFTNPGIWAKNAKQSFANIWKTFGKDEVMNELNADLVSRPNALNDYYKRSKLALGTVEEAFPTSLPEKIPVAGKLYKASENAYTAFIYKTRADVFDKYIHVAEKSGVDLTDKELESIGKLVNSLTGRGSLGKAEPMGGFVNNILFSGRNLKSNIDVLTAHTFEKMTPFARKQAAVNLIKIASGTAAILAIANSVKPGSVEWDPRSSDFGKIKVGDSRFDVSGGMASIVTLASRIIKRSSKSSTTGNITKLNSGEYGSQTVKDVIYSFFENKLSPVASVIKDLAEGQTFSGDKPSVLNETQNLFVPLPITNYIELRDNPNSANMLVSLMADALGIGVNTYGKSNNKSSQVLNDNRSPIQKIIGLPVKEDKSLTPIIQKMTKEDVSIKLPGSKTTIQPDDADKSRPMTEKELPIYQKIYINNMKEELKANKKDLLNLSGKDFEDEINYIKKNVAEQSKYDFLDKMIK